VREFGFRDGLGRNEDIALGLEMDGRAAEKGRFLQALRHTAGGNELKEWAEEQAEMKYFK
jgi:hypothetical protein